MSLKAKLLSASGGVDKIYVDDVFSAYTYTGTSTTQTINNGIDLAGKGGLVWTKRRDAVQSHTLIDTLRGVTNYLKTDTTLAQETWSAFITSFNTTGFTEGGSNPGSPIISWTFRKAPKFFDVVTYTGNGVSGRQIPHALGIAPGMIIVKCTSAIGDWQTYHRSVGATYRMQLNETSNAILSSAAWNNTEPTATVFTVGTASHANTNGATYVAYLFAHDTSADGIIQCGSMVGDANDISAATLGWEPQFLIIKSASDAQDWRMFDSARGLTANGTSSANARLSANSSGAESNSSAGYINATGLGGYNGGVGGLTYIYLAIRRPNKPPTVGTQVYQAIAYAGTNSAGQVLSGVGFPPDLLLPHKRNVDGGFHQTVIDRLRGGTSYLFSDSTAAEATTAGYYIQSFNMDGVTYGTAYGDYTNAAYNYIAHFFRRYPGVFDEVCYTGTGVGVGLSPSHNLTVVPQLMIMKERAPNVGPWRVYDTFTGSDNYMALNTTAATASGYGTYWNNTIPTASVFSVSSSNNILSSTYVAYLFATLAGISKVFSFTGNGTNQNIECGFTTGARFVLLKRTDSTGNWLVADTARGLISGNDPSLSLNSTAAEVTTVDWIDPYAGGFNIVQEATNNANVNGATYIGLAIA